MTSQTAAEKSHQKIVSLLLQDDFFIYPFNLNLFWSGKRGSNSRPQPWQGCTLPTELFPQFLFIKKYYIILPIMSTVFLIFSFLKLTIYYYCDRYNYCTYHSKHNYFFTCFIFSISFLYPQFHSFFIYFIFIFFKYRIYLLVYKVFRLLLCKSRIIFRNQYSFHIF